MESHYWTCFGVTDSRIMFWALEALGWLNVKCMNAWESMER